MKTRATRQREELAHILKKQKTYFTSNEFFTKVEKENNRISRATMFRFLKELRKKSKITSFICNRKLLYTLNHNNHAHFICELCGTKQHISIKDLSSLAKSVSGSLCHFNLDMYGMCERCKEKERE
jgi:Fe2+ or Zn2+ uptake regulation protein